jgi:amino acid transporter
MVDYDRKDDSVESKGTLGTFAGVFTPSILTILGIILFLRLGYVVGSAGLARTLIIIGIANAISVLTSFSLSAIATNLKVKEGGDYYLISRTLGVEYGGAIGIVLFLAQSVSIAFYCIGFGEAVSAMFPEAFRALPQIIAALALSFLFIFAWLGADWATRLQYLVMAVLAAALFSFFIGGLNSWDNANITENWSSPASGPGFWILFAIFFPAVTGFTQGVSMSGDLKNPGRSLPLGTFLAVGISILVYFGAAVVFASALPRGILANDYEAMEKAALFGILISAGVIAATLSSAMASFLGAPRILQSMAGDRIFPFLLPFAKGDGPNGNPRRGVILSAVIAFLTIGFGKLNTIAPIVSMFFLISYGLLNYATYFEARSASPSFRPTFRWFDARLSLLGFLTCLGAMLAIDMAAGAIAISILFAIYQYLKRTGGPSRWADSRRSYYLQRIRESLIAAASEPEHPRDWRPQLLAFSNDPTRREHLLRFASWIEGGSGLTTAVRILEGECAKMLKLREEAEEELRKYIAEHKLKAFPLVITAPDLKLGIYSLVQAVGIGPIKVNTILLNWLDQEQKGVPGIGLFRYSRNLRVAFRLGCNISILSIKEDAWDSLMEIPPEKKQIDVWWQDDATGQLMLLMAYLMTRCDAWDNAKIRVLSTRDLTRASHTAEDLRSILEKVWIDAEAKVVNYSGIDSIIEASKGSSIVFLPFRLRGDSLVTPFDANVEEMISALPVTALVLAAEDIDLDAEPEEGKSGELAEAYDAFKDAEKRGQTSEKELARITEEVDERTHELESAISSGADKNFAEKLRASIEAKEKADKALRRQAKALAKAEDAARKVESLGGKIDKEDEEA